MKTQDIKRGITSRHYRSGGSSPDIGKLSRLRDADTQSGGGRRSRRRNRSPEAEKRSSTIGLILLGGSALAVITASVFLWLIPRLDPDPVEMVSHGVEPEGNVRVASRFPSPSREESLDLVKDALATRNPEAIPALFRMGDSTPDEIVAFLKNLARRDGAIESYEWLSSLDKDGLLIEGVLVRSEGDEKPVARLALLTPDEAGVWKLDFEAYARLVEPSWQELLEKGAEAAVVRVTVAPDVYYNGPFSDDKQWVCYGISSPDVNEKLRGYCRKGSVQAEAMARLFNHEEKASRATVEIRRVKDAGARQFEITRLLGGEWLVAGNR